MKKVFIIIVALCVFAVSSRAQVAVPSVPNQAAQANIPVQEYEYVNLLREQNKLLKSFKYSIITELAGVAAISIGSGLVDEYDNLTSAGTAFVGTGLIVATIGSVWFMIDGFKLINSQRRINEHLIIKTVPGGVALQF
ncbi:MAG: hypothetical protein IJQ93_01560 [Bacteroidales bacterium]|nr:hypothetical protein [Bacteroidales bacterium]